MDRPRLSQNLGLKVGSLAVAMLLWLHITTERSDYERILEIPIVITGVPQDMVIARPVPESARVRFRGKGKRLLTLPFRETRVVLDASGIQTMGTRTLQRDSVVYPEAVDLQVVEVISPRSMEIHLDRLAERRLPVQPFAEITPEPGYTLVGPVRTSPETVLVIGPRSPLDVLRSVPTETLRVERARRPVDREAILILTDLHNMTITPPVVRVQADIQQLGERVFAEVPVQVVGSPEGRYLAQPRTATVTVTGGSRLLGDLQAAQVQVVLDLADGSTDGLIPIQPHVVLPDGMTLLRIDPPRFRVTEYQD